MLTRRGQVSCAAAASPACAARSTSNRLPRAQYSAAVAQRLGEAAQGGALRRRWSRVGLVLHMQRQTCCRAASRPALSAARLAAWLRPPCFPAPASSQRPAAGSRRPSGARTGDDGGRLVGHSQEQDNVGVSQAGHQAALCGASRAGGAGRAGSGRGGPAGAGARERRVPRLAACHDATPNTRSALEGLLSLTLLQLLHDGGGERERRVARPRRRRRLLRAQQQLDGHRRLQVGGQVDLRGRGPGMRGRDERVRSAGWPGAREGGSCLGCEQRPPASRSVCPAGASCCPRAPVRPRASLPTHAPCRSCPRPAAG